ncbi:hypothetical protein C8A00DRAFT_44652 [Chaetomidium leptoderma]|uniref:DUF7905 domain-containing protein n=1 Tax=Chaetomidium leptoderma TaxID=669021 RepID=A0AAN6ZXA9_9PEZI|nr:hypothetical protein C8A00DRAFT_44652 [Chaetomidium leptoderma]
MRQAAGDGQVPARPAPKLNVTVHVSLPAPVRGFKDVDPSDADIKDLLNRIAGEHAALIEAKEIDSSVAVTVRATNRAKAQEIIAVLRNTFLYRPGEEVVWRAHPLVHHPRDGGVRLTAVLQPKEGTAGRRATAAATGGLAIAESIDAVATATDYKKGLVKTLDETVEILGYVYSSMRMRVQFGTLILNEWKKDKVEYNLTELENLVRRSGIRGTTRMLSQVSETAAKALKDQLAQSGEKPTRTYALVMETKNLHVESEFEPVQAQGKFATKTKQAQQYRLGPLKLHQLDKQQRVAEVITACPESVHDWGVEIRKLPGKKDAKPHAPFNVEQLLKHVTFTGESFGEGFPNVAIFKDFRRRNDIETVLGKATLKYELGEYMQYTLEISLFHKLEQETSETPEPTASVVLRCDDWDYDMLSVDFAPREWDNSFSKQFLPRNGHGPREQEQSDKTEEPMDQFLSWIEWIQKGLDGGA